MATADRPFPTVFAEDRFSVCLDHVLRTEGAFNDIPEDRGGATNFGISLRFAQAEASIDPATRRALDMDMDGDVDHIDIRLLDREAAAAVYRRSFWDRYRCGELPVPIDGMLFDQAVNGGGVAAVKLLQQAINLALGRPELFVDGRIGRRTIAAAKVAVLKIGLVGHFRHLARRRYQAIASAAPSQRKFLRGWLVRADRLGSV